MTHRTPHLTCYDVTEPRRLRAALKLTRRYATGGQLSAHELYLNHTESLGLLEDMRDLLELDSDRFLLLRLDPRSRVHTLGCALPLANPDFFHVG